jgi:hypothetical protein
MVAGTCQETDAVYAIPRPYINVLINNMLLYAHFSLHSSYKAEGDGSS